MIPANAKDITVAMTACLVAAGIPDTERDAIRMLCANGFRYGDVAALAHDALFAARQTAVTAAITAPSSSQFVPTTAASPALTAAAGASPRPSIEPEDGGDAPEQAEHSEAVSERRKQVRS